MIDRRRARLGRDSMVSLFALLLLCPIAGAWQQPGQTQPQASPAQASKPPAAPDKDVAAPVDPKTYKIGAEDVLMVRVWREPELTGNVVVRPDGRITLPLIGDLEAAGLTPEQLTRRVTESFSKILNKPEVMISVMEVQSKRYFVSGRVLRSGPMPLVTPTTMLQALSVSGFAEWANKKKIVIMRGSERLKFNYNDVIKGKNLEQNIYLQDGDHIYVP